MPSPISWRNTGTASGERALTTLINSDRYHVRKGLAITLIGGLLFSFELPLLRLAQTSNQNLIFARGLLLFLSISIVWWLVRTYRNSREPFISGWAGWSIVATNTIATVSYITAVTKTDAANVVFITALIPIATALMARIFLGERVHIFTWAATILSMVGLGFIAGDSLQLGWDQAYGDILAFISCLCTAAAFTIIRASGKNVATSLGTGSLCSALFAFVFLSPVLTGPGSMSAQGWIWVALAGLIVIPLASTLIANGPRFLPSVDVSMFFLLETALTPFWTFLLFAEVPRENVMKGGAIVLGTLIAHSLWRLTDSLRVSRSGA